MTELAGRAGTTPEAQGRIGRALRDPAVWVFAISLLLGALFLRGDVLGYASARPVDLVIVATVVMILTTVPLIVLARAMRLGRGHPLDLSPLALGWGAVAAAGFGLVGAAGWSQTLGAATSLDAAGEWAQVLVGPPIEEAAKLLGVPLILLVVRRSVGRSLDAFVLGGLVGIGFTLTEEVHRSLFTTSAGIPSGALVEYVVMLTLTGGLYGHPLFTGLAALGIVAPRGIAATRWRVPVRLAFFFTAAVLLHALANSPVTIDPVIEALRAGDPLAIFATLVARSLPLAAFIVIVVVLRRRDG